MATGPTGGGQTQTPNINVLASKGVQGAGMGTAQGMAFDPGTLAQTNLQQYQNPYTKQVIDASTQDIMRGAQMGLNELGRQATQAGAFGGSRHGVAMGELGRGTAEEIGQMASSLRQQGFTQAQAMAQQDIQNRLAGAQHRLGASAQMADIANLGFGMGQTVTQNLAQQGAQQQAMQQALIDQAKAQYQGYTQAPVTSLGYVSSALGATPVPQTQTTSRQPGLFDYLTLGASFMPK